MDLLENIIYLTTSFVSFFKKGKIIKTIFQSIVLLLCLLGFFNVVILEKKKNMHPLVQINIYQLIICERSQIIVPKTLCLKENKEKIIEPREMRKISDDFLKSDIPRNEGFFSVEIKDDHMFTLLFPSSEFKKL